nr:phage terminase large subunit [Carnobacterium maltaromaticum]
MLSNLEMETLAKQAESVLNQNYFDHYVKFAHNGQYEHFRHTKLVCKYLQRIADGEQLALMIEMPPRHGKSMTVTESFPSFYLGKNPGKRVITASYSDSLAKKFGRKNKDKFKEFAGPLNNLELSKTNAAVKDWGIEGHSGGMLSTGVGGSITGHGADLMIIDDPIKNQQDASSETIREKIWDEWESTLSTRLHGGASVIVVMTRWHEDDIIGRLLKQGARPWIRLRLPAVAEDETDLLHRKIGEVLCPELGYDEKWAKQKQKEVGSRTWSSLYQQRPTPAGGSIFKRKWVKYYVPSREVKDRLNLSDETIILPRLFDKQVQSWDCTFKDAETSDFVAGQVWAKKKTDYFLLARRKEKLNFTATLKAIREMSENWPNARAKYVEDKANGSAVISVLENEISGIIPVNPEGGKEVRANAVAPVWESGNVYLPHPDYAPWVNEFLDELEAFPNGAHDDEVDAMTQALIKITSSGRSLLERYRNG